MILKPKNFLLLFLIFAIKREGNCEDNNGLIIVESPDGNDESNFNKVENIYGNFDCSNINNEYIYKN